VDAIDAASMLEPYWFLHGRIELYVGAEEQACQDRNKRSKVSGRPRAGDFFPLLNGSLRAPL
jgi:hypothetical protein